MKLSLNAPSRGPARLGWKRDSSVLVDFTEQVLVVDELQLSPPKRCKSQSQPLEFLARNSRNRLYDLLGTGAPQVGEAPTDSRPCSRTSHHKFVFGKVNHLAIV